VSELIKMTGSPRALSDVYTEASKSTSLVLSVDRNTVGEGLISAGHRTC